MEEKVICSECDGSGRIYMNMDSLLYNQINNEKNKAVSGIILELLKCRKCRGKGYISWIDNLFG